MLPTEQMFLWEPNNSISPHYLHVMYCSNTLSTIYSLDSLMKPKVLRLWLYLVEHLPRVEGSSYLGSSRIPLYSSVSLFRSDTLKQSFHFTFLAGVSDSGLPPMVQASRVLFRARSSVGQPPHSPLSHRLHCCLSRCSLPLKTKGKKSHKFLQKKECFCARLQS